MDPLDARRGWTLETSTFAVETVSLLRLPREGSAAPSRPPLVVALHGMGLTCRVFARLLAPLWKEPWALWFPQGMYPLEIRRGVSRSVGYAWYMYRGDEDEWLHYLERTEEHLLRLLDRLTRRHRVDPDRVILVGHSQGCYLGYFLALRHPRRFRGFAAIGGRLKHAFLQDRLEAASRRLPILILHGSQDRAVPVDAAEASYRTLRRHGFDVERRIHPSGHFVHPAQVRDLREWIRRRVTTPGRRDTSCPPRCPPSDRPPCDPRAE